MQAVHHHGLIGQCVEVVAFECPQAVLIDAESLGDGLNAQSAIFPLGFQSVAESIHQLIFAEEGG